MHTVFDTALPQVPFCARCRKIGVVNNRDDLFDFIQEHGIVGFISVADLINNGGAMPQALTYDPPIPAPRTDIGTVQVETSC